jgi:hypothetical protein
MGTVKLVPELMLKQLFPFPMVLLALLLLLLLPELSYGRSQQQSGLCHWLLWIWVETPE